MLIAAEQGQSLKRLKQQEVRDESLSGPLFVNARLCWLRPAVSGHSWSLRNLNSGRFLKLATVEEPTTLNFSVMKLSAATTPSPVIYRACGVSGKADKATVKEVPRGS